MPRTISTTPYPDHAVDPATDCALCPRLVAYRAANRDQHPGWHNAPAPPFGDLNARLLVVGLAPGLMGANRTGRVFTGDAAGRLLFETLLKTGFASGDFRDDGRDSLRLHDCLVTNAVLCAPPGNRPLPVEEATCRPHLRALIDAMHRLEVIVTLGEVARKNTLKALGFPLLAVPAGHGSWAQLGRHRLVNSYHCSRLNVNTGRLTPAMFEAIFRDVYSPSQ